MNNIKAVFLDRDGIINVDKGYVSKFEEVEWMPGVIDFLLKLKNMNFTFFVMTNQSGIGRGYYTEDDVVKLHSEMNEFLLKNGIEIKKWYYSVSLEDPNRKPNPGLFLKCAEEFHIDLHRSFMIGDKESDVINLDGPRYIILKGRYPLGNLAKHACLVYDFKEAYEVIKSIS